ncbi:MAG: methylated-DNA--[protein]-cysteine S-methyltransferase [Hydrogenophaga sp.]|nr:methylated-DNA--[protein]-cysteine S-methyltransferase [Hydrogenophaga sp.]
MNNTVQCFVTTPLGAMRLAAGPKGLLGAWFQEDAHGPPPERFRQWPEAPQHPVLIKAGEQLERYFSGRLRNFDLPLDLDSGTPFQVNAWAALLEIPWGETISYGQLAQRLGRPSAARAAGAAIGRNPLSIIVPCHRVVGSKGALTGYAGGLPRKTALLRLEQSTSPP